MFRDTQAYDKGIERIKELQQRELSHEESYELELLMSAAQDYEASRDAEAEAEYEAMQAFEDRFTASWER